MREMKSYPGRQSRSQSSHGCPSRLRRRVVEDPLRPLPLVGQPVHEVEDALVLVQLHHLVHAGVLATASGDGGGSAADGRQRGLLVGDWE